ncbi:MAG: hypothetical protein FWH54_02825 [Methanobrevibacter sp.]|nr:hypothetical protein [Methanobrevibacter sp.]
MKAKNFKRIWFLALSLIVVLVSMQACFAANVTINNGTTILTGISGTGNGDTLFLNPGTYNKINDSNITINQNITIQGNGAIGSVTIDGRGEKFMFEMESDINVIFVNIVFINKFSDDSMATIFNDYASTTMTFINCTFTNNTGTVGSPSGDAFVIYNANGNLTIINSNFTNNKGYNIAPITNREGNMTIRNSIFTNNTGQLGGAIRNYGGIPNHEVIIINSTFTNNTAKYGGAINNDGGNLSSTSCIFIENTATENGDVIYNQNGDVLVNFSVFFNKQLNSHVAFSSNGMVFLNDNFYFWVNPDLTNMTGLINKLAYQNTDVKGFYYLNITNNTVLYVGDIFDIKSALQHNNNLNTNNLPNINIALLFNGLKINEFNYKAETSNQLLVSNLNNIVTYAFDGNTIYQLPVNVINRINQPNNNTTTNNTTTTNNGSSTNKNITNGNTTNNNITDGNITSNNGTPNDSMKNNGNVTDNNNNPTPDNVIMKKTGLPIFGLLIILLGFSTTVFRRRRT